MQVELLADLILEIESSAPHTPSVSTAADDTGERPTAEDRSGHGDVTEDPPKPNQKLTAVRLMRKLGAITARELGLALWGSDDKDTAHRASVVLSGLKKMGWAQSAGDAKWTLTRRAPV